MQKKISKLFSIIVVLSMIFALAISYSGNATAAPLQSISLTGGAYTQDFNTLVNTGTSSTLPTDWYFNETGTNANTTYTAGTGSGNTGDTYSFGSASATDRALGGLLSGSLVPSYGAKFINNTGSTITSLDISYYGEQWRLGALARSDRIDFQYSLDATSLTTGAWNDVNALDFTAPITGPTVGALDGNAAANRTLISSSITSLSIANGATFWIRWTDFNATSSDDGLAVDDFSITPVIAAATPNLSIDDIANGEGDAGTTTYTFTVSLDSPAGVGGVTFDIATQDNSATDADNDYEINSLTGETIAEGLDTYTFDVTVNGDTNIEFDESFFVNVTNVTGANVTDGQGEGSIVNDDFSGTPNLSIDDVTQNEGQSGTTTFTFTVSLDIPAEVGGVTFDIATQDNSATDADNDYEINSLTNQTIAEGFDTYTFDVTVNGDTALEGDEDFYVNVTNVTGAAVTDDQGLGTITNDDVAITLISSVQGSGSTSPLTGTTVTVEAIVVGDFQTQGSGQLRGFFLQEEDADVDGDPDTSEGIFIFCSSCPTAVAVGDKVLVTGSVSEYFNMTQITASTAGSVTVLSSGNPLPTPASITLPIPGVPSGDLATATSFINAYYETMEGMLVTFPATLYVSEYFELARYGQVVLTAGGRPRTFTDANLPSPTGYIDNEIDLLKSTVILDDGDNRQNRPVDTPNTAYFHPYPGLSITNYFRGGDTIVNLTGVLHWSFAGLTGTDAWRIRPVTEAYSYAFTSANPRPSMPSVGGTLKVASFNVLNYFLTVDTSNTCGPTLNHDCRGADTTAELALQRAKLLAALSAIDADVFGFMEMENSTGVEPLADIVAGLPGYAYIDTGVIGTDDIRVGIIYKTSTVTPIGSFEVLDTAAFLDPNSTGTNRNRPALAQTFEEIATGGRFTLVVNHLKSKGCSGSETGLDADQADGQSCWNDTRKKAATALLNWLATDPTSSGDPDFLIIGDLNSNAKEDPISIIVNGGYTNLVNSFGGADAYGYVFDGQLGYLDHALSNSTLTPQVAGVAEWHINADEIPLFDYNDDVKDAGESAFEEESDVYPLYEANAYRTSDHDPVIIGLNLDGTPPTITVPADITAEATSASGASVSYIVTVSDLVDPNPSLTCSPLSGSTFPLGTTTVNCSASDYAGNTSTASFEVEVVDTTAPTLNVPADITVPQTTAGAVVNFTVTANDAVDANPTIVCVPPSGSTFPLGATMVNCSATDDYNNTSYGSFTVTVQTGINLLKKPDFSGASIFPTPWQLFGVNLPYSSALSCTIYQSPSCSVYFPAGNRSAMQRVLRSGVAGDTYSFGLSSMSQNAPIGGNYRVEVTFYNNFNRPVGTYSVDFSPLTHTWETVNGYATAMGNYNRIVFRFYYQNSNGRVWFDDAFLYFLSTLP